MAARRPDRTGSDTDDDWTEPRRTSGEHDLHPLDPDPLDPDPLDGDPLPWTSVRAGPTWLPAAVSERLDALADATGTGPLRLIAGAGAVALVVAAAAWSMRPPPPPPELELPTVAVAPGPDAPPTPEGALAPGPFEVPEAPAVVVVHMAGAVHAPGVHELPAGARVLDAITAAGGLRDGADEARVNLAAPVADGERIYVPREGEEPPVAVVGSSPSGSAGGGPGGAGAPSAPVDLNRATAAELEALPGVGPATAAAIIEHRERSGPFRSVEQLLEVRGIGPAKLEQLAPHARV